MTIEREIYLDSHASTRVDQDVLHAMLPYFTEYYGNGDHKAGWKSGSALEAGRNQVAALIGARPSEIIFTSGATEAINLAILGLAQTEGLKRKHIVTQKTEHKAVLECLRSLEIKGFTVTYLNVDADGRINIEDLREKVNADTLMVAIMLANNEIGTVQPVKEIGAICRSHGARFLCDLTQGLGWHPVNMDEMNIDLAACSSHKIYGPKGVGALFLRRSAPKIHLAPVLMGGGQEKGIRPGTYNIPGIVGFGKACELLSQNTSSVFEHIRELRDYMQDIITNSIDGVKVNGCKVNRHPGNLNISIPGILGEKLKNDLPTAFFSTTSACTSGSTKPSHVLSALQLTDDQLKGAIRIGIGKYNTKAEIAFVSNQIIDRVTGRAGQYH